MFLEVEGLEVSYSQKKVLHGVSLEMLSSGDILAILGPNGAGKSTLFKAIAGLLKVDTGKVKFQGQDIANRRALVNVKDGICYCPQGAQVFTDLSVIENLDVAGRVVGDVKTAKENVAKMLELFPSLQARRSMKAGVLSGGERQMLAFGMALMSSPKLLMLDEPSGGLAPMVVDRLFETIRFINEKYHVGILIIEQNVEHALSISNKVFMLSAGQIVYRGDPKDMSREEVQTKALWGA